MHTCECVCVNIYIGMCAVHLTKSTPQPPYARARPPLGARGVQGRARTTRPVGDERSG